MCNKSKGEKGTGKLLCSLDMMQITQGQDAKNGKSRAQDRGSGLPLDTRRYQATERSRRIYDAVSPPGRP